MRRAARTDDNQGKIVAALRAVGATVQSLAAVGSGVPDLLVGINGRNHLMEVKDGDKPPSRQSLTTDEMIWHDQWKGKVEIVNSVEQALAAIGAKLQ